MLKTLISFIKNPFPIVAEELSMAEKWKITLKLLGVIIFSSVLAGISIDLILNATNVDTGTHAMETLLEKYPLIFIVGIAVLIAPALEELIFRAPLTLVKKPEVFKIVYYLSAVLFASVHLSNFESGFPLWLSPLLVLPQFFAGLVLGYTRVRLGLFWSITLHALHNGLLIIPLLIAKALDIPLS